MGRGLHGRSKLGTVCRPCELDSPGNKRLCSDREVCLKRLLPGESSSQGFHRRYPRIQRNLRLRVLSFAFLRLNSYNLPRSE